MRMESTISGSRRWAVTCSATLVSMYALDAIAATAGLLLAASGLLQPLDRWVLLSVLVCTYVAWGAGLLANLHANWSLLEATGTSTNALSKAAHDIADRRTSGRRTRWVAAAAGYTSTELAKEVPYYAGAFGAALVTDGVSTGDAIIFLAGANLGAAIYESGLARLTRAFLSFRSSRESTATPCGHPDPTGPVASR